MYWFLNISCWWADIAAKLSCDVVDVEHKVILLKLNGKGNGEEYRNRQHKISRCSPAMWPLASTAFASLKFRVGDFWFVLHTLATEARIHARKSVHMWSDVIDVSWLNFGGKPSIFRNNLFSWQKANSDIHTPTEVPISLEHPRFLQNLSQKIYTVSSDFDKWRKVCSNRMPRFNPHLN